MNPMGKFNPPMIDKSNASYGGKRGMNKRRVETKPIKPMTKRPTVSGEKRWRRK